MLSVEDVELADAPLSDEDAGLAAGDLPLSLKSLTYQPEPLSWKPAAVTCLAYVDCPH